MAKMVTRPPPRLGRPRRARPPSHRVDTQRRRHTEGHPTEELHWPLPVVDEELHGQQVEDHTGHARDPVLGDAQLAGPVVDRNLDDLGPRDQGQGRDEAVHLPEELEVLDDLPVVSLQRAPEVVKCRPVTREMMALAAIEGSRRDHILSLRSARQPEATS